MNYKNLALIEAVAVIALIAVSAYTVVTYPGPSAPIRLNGAGATFPAPLYQKWGSEYYSLTGVQVNYQGIGSGAGVKQLLQKTVDFGASDPPMGTTDWSNATTQGPPGALHIPMAIGGIIVTYNIPGVTAKLNFTGYLLAAIFQGNITHWNDANITALNPALTSVTQAIVICHRSDSSGSTKIITTFLQDSETGNYGSWKLGAGNTVPWPGGSLGGSGNSGVAALVQSNQYSIGYVELQYALGSSLIYGKIKNPAGFFIEPSLSSLTAAVGAVTTSLPAGNASWASQGVYFNLKSNSSNADTAYPVTSFTYILVYKNLKNVPGMTAMKAQALKAFLFWAVNEGQSYSPALSYVPLPANVVALDEITIGSIYFA